jgi:hypothetical protein
MNPSSAHPSVLGGDHVVVRIREHEVWLGKRRLTRYGQHGSLVALPAAAALRLVEDRAAKLPAEITLRQLRLHVDGLAERQRSTTDDGARHEAIEHV